MDFHSMKRRELQALCKEHKIRANLTNLEMADRLSSLFKSSLINSAEKMSENDSDIAEKRLKKARFSSETENERIGTTPKRSEITSAEVFKDKLVVEDGVITQPEMGLRRSKRIADKHVNGPIMAVQNANRRKSMMPNIKKVIIGIRVADEEELEDNHQKRLESNPKSCLKKQTSVYTELSDSKKVGNSVTEGNEELQIKELPLVLSVTGVVDTLALGNEELQPEESPLSAYAVADNSVIATVNDDILCCQTPLTGSDGIEHGMPMTMGETSRKVGDEQEPQEVIGAKEWKPVFSKDFVVFEKQMSAVHSENTSSSVKGMDGLQDQNGKQIVSSAVLKADDCSKDINDSHQFMEPVPQLVMKFGETDCHLKEMVQGMDEKDFLVQGVDEVNKVKDVEATRNGIDEASGVPTEVLLVNEDGMEEDAAAKLLHGNETQTLTEETNEGHGSSDYFNDTSEEYHSNQKHCLQHEQIEVCKSTLADRGAEIFEGIMSVREDLVYNDSVGVGCQESREEDMNFSETDSHLKEMVQGMDEKDLLVQKVVDVMKVKDVEDTEVLLINEDGMEEDADTKLLHGNETQTSIVENNEAHGSSDYFNGTSEEYHSNQKLCLQHEQIEASKSMLADRGAKIFEGIMSVREDSVYNDSVGMDCQESREEDMNFRGTDCHLKEMVQGMDEKDLLVQKVVDVMKVKDVEATEVLLINEDGMEEDADTKLLHGNETQTSIVENNEAHGSSDYFNDTSEEYHSNQKLCLQHECIKVSNTTLTDRGAEIFDGIMFTGKDPVYNDSIDIVYQESTGEAAAVEETTKIYFEGNLCMGGAHHDLDGQLSLAGEKGMEIICSNSGDVKEIRTHETFIGETSSPIIFEETNIDRAGIMCSASAGLSATVSDYSLHCQTPLKGSDESEQGMAMSLDETSRKVGEEEEPQEVIEEKENGDASLSRVNVMQNTEEEIFSPGSEESEQENQLRMLFGTPDTFSTCCNEKKSPSNDAENAEGTAFRFNESDAECLFKFNLLQNTEKEITSLSSMESEQEKLLKILSVTPDTKSTSLSEQQTSGQAAEISAVSISSENNLKKSILGRFSRGKSLKVVELKESEVNERSALKSKGEEITGKGSNNIDDEIASPGPLGFIKVMFEDGNEPVKGNVKTPFGDLLEEGGGCIEISGKVTSEILGDDVSKADDFGKDTNDSCPFVETVPQFDMTIGETDRHLKDLFLGMDERDFLVQGVVEDVEAARYDIVATDGKHFDLGGEASGIPTEELLRNEYAMKEDAPAKLLHFPLGYLNVSSEHGDTEFTVDSDMLSSELKLFGSADEVEGDKSNAWSRKNNFVIENSEDAGENSEASSETKLRMDDQPPAYDNCASDKVAAAVNVWKGQLERDMVETKDSEAISEGKIPVRHLFSTILTQKTPGKSIMTADMKENAQSFKRQPGSLIAAKSTKKRRALEEL